ncbi:hypothetical protein [Nocardia inohanensis]|uniref:hypothetical protein n=1 Tax=Nocardia inohanensis TaxID=209246 RepID=UPI000A5D13B9|nr:hypothetical protein [Nocardia inohanensis]
MNRASPPCPAVLAPASKTAGRRADRVAARRYLRAAHLLDSGCAMHATPAEEGPLE